MESDNTCKPFTVDTVSVRRERRREGLTESQFHYYVTHVHLLQYFVQHLSNIRRKHCK